MSDKQVDQGVLDAHDSRKWQKCAVRRPGDSVTVRGTLPCGKLGAVVHGQVLNACLRADGSGDQVLVATTIYGRRWFGAQGSCYQLLSPST